MKAYPILALLLALPAHAATLRDAARLGAGPVRLSDLWEGVAEDRPIGPGPELGGRFVVEAPQLAAIARQFGVDWQPSSAGDRIVVERPGRPLPREQALAALRAALATSGVATDAEIDMPGFTSPSIPATGPVTADVGELDYAPASGRFTAMLSVAAPGMAPVHARLSGTVEEMVSLPLATRRMLPGDIVGPGDIRMGRLRANAIHDDVAQIPAQALGMALRRAIGPGAPVPIADLGHPILVHRGDPVQMELTVAGLSLTGQGVAMESAALGDQLRVLNPGSRAVVLAELLGAGRVRVTGAAPTLLPPGASVPLRVAAR